LWRESQQIMSRIAKQNKVLYFEPGRDFERSALTELWRNSPNFVALRPQRLHENLIVIPTPSCLPTARRYLPRAVLQTTTPWVVRFNTQILLRQMRWAMKEFGVKAPILWLQDPLVDLIGKFGEKLACYYNYDEVADFVVNIRIKEILQRMDDETTGRVDVVFATSRAQWKRRKAINPNTYFIPNGVDFDIFNRALSPGQPLPADLACIPRPIIGFAGWLGWHIDVELLCRVAAAYPECSLVLIGPDQLPNVPARAQLLALPNVFFLGQKERHELPNYLQAFDVALMPWSLNGHIRSAYPLKLHEYLAAGRASVATALPELRPFRHVVRLAETPEEFIYQIRQALLDCTSEAVEARVAIARENTWDHRVLEMYRILQQYLGEADKS
jgi:glycosyltransferase involved in cell wall biosynthesis